MGPFDLLNLFLLGYSFSVTVMLVAAWKVRDEELESRMNVGRKNREPHAHRFDTMHGDGVWRCGVCNKAKRR